MKPLSLQAALTDEELDRLGDFLNSCDDAMNLEELDGFFAAMVAGPDLIPPSVYLPEVFGGPLSEACGFSGIEQMNDILGLMLRHWNHIAGNLQQGEVHLPLLRADDDGVRLGNDWAGGFMRGVGIRHEPWADLFEDEKEFEWMIPVLMLYHEHSEDPESRPEPIDPEKRKNILNVMSVGVTRIYQFFLKRRVRPAAPRPAPRGPAKVGRNEPCPCGSGKKFKRCCGDVTVH